VRSPVAYDRLAAHGAAERYRGAMTARPKITQRDLRNRFVPRAEFAAMSRTASDISLEVFRADQVATAEQETDDPYAR
jgi:hypothetical protein